MSRTQEDRRTRRQRATAHTVALHTSYETVFQRSKSDIISYGIVSHMASKKVRPRKETVTHMASDKSHRQNLLLRGNPLMSRNSTTSAEMNEVMLYFMNLMLIVRVVRTKHRTPRITNTLVVAYLTTRAVVAGIGGVLLPNTTRGSDSCCEGDSGDNA